MSDTMEAVLRELGQALSALRVFLLEEEGVLVDGNIDRVQATLCQREVFLARIENLSQQYQLLHTVEENQTVPARSGEEEQKQLIQDIKRQAGAVAYQNRVNAQVLYLRRAELSTAVCVFPRLATHQEGPLYSRDGHYIYSDDRRIYTAPQDTGGPSDGQQIP